MDSIQTNYHRVMFLITAPLTEWLRRKQHSQPTIRAYLLFHERFNDASLYDVFDCILSFRFVLLNIFYLQHNIQLTKQG